MQSALEKGIINLSDVQEQMLMNKTKEVLEMHKYKIWQGENGLWYTYLSDETKPNGRRLVKKKTQEKLNKSLVDFYSVNEQKTKSVITFKKCYYSYRELKSEIVSNNTLVKYDSDYKRFFEDTWLSDYDITKVFGDRLDIFVIKRIQELSLNQKATKAMIGYLKSIFIHARINGMIGENPCNFLKPTTNYLRYCQQKIIKTEDRIASKDEIATVMKQLKKDQLHKPHYMPTYAVELSILTGMRVGEMAALTWDSIKDDMIIIDKEEIFDRLNNTYYVASYTKNRKPRIIPITSEIRRVLSRIEEIEKMFGYYGTYVFMDGRGKINKRTLGECARNKSKQAGLDKAKGIHCYRRTVNSTMKCDGVSSTITSSLLGNTEEVNENYYTYDITDIEQKRIILERANAEMLGKCGNL